METRRDFHECVRWLRRAAESASEASRSDRALALAKAAAELTQRLEETTDVGERHPNTAQMEQVPAAQPQGQLLRPHVSLHAPSPPMTQPYSPPAAQPHATHGAPVEGPTERVKVPLPKRITPPKEATKLQPQAVTAAVPMAQSPGNMPKPAPMRARAPSTTEEWDAMPTQALSSEDLAHIARTDETPALSEEIPTSSQTSPHQAVRVRVWKDGGGVHIAPASTHVSAPSVEAMLVGLDGTDLHAWISGVTPPPRR